MAPSAGRGGGSGQRDTLSDFFDFSKPWVRKERVLPNAPRLVEVDPLSVPPPATSEEEEAAETEEQWQKYQVLSISVGLQSLMLFPFAEDCVAAADGAKPGLLPRCKHSWWSHQLHERRRVRHLCRNTQYQPAQVELV